MVIYGAGVSCRSSRGSPACSSDAGGWLEGYCGECEGQGPPKKGPGDDP